MSGTIASSTKIGAMKAHAALSASANGDEVDTKGFYQVFACVKLGTTSGTSATASLRLQHSDTSGSGYTDVTGSDTGTQALDAGAGTGKTFSVSYAAPTKRYVRYLIVLAGTTPVAGDTSAALLLGSGTYSTVGAGADKTLSL